MRKPSLVAVALVATLSVLGASAEAQYDWVKDLPGGGAGCDPSRPAVAHHADQQVLPQQPANGPVPCGTSNTYMAVEPRIEVTKDAVIYMPAVLPGNAYFGGSGNMFGHGRPIAIARSFNEGDTWQAVYPEVWPLSEVSVAQGGVDNNLYVDHDTGRLFWYQYNSFPRLGHTGRCGNERGATVVFTDDSGTTWDWGFDLDFNCSENPTILAAKPTLTPRPVGQEFPKGYPNVVYLCGTSGITNTGVAGTGNTGRSCSKTLDGGKNWRGVTLKGQGCYAGLCKDRVDPYPECNGESSSSSASVQPLPDGRLVVIVTCGDNTYLSQTEDEGASWSIVRQIPHGGTLRADSQGN
ncbi:MAG: sialidase family protein, partial [bacterium]